MAAMVSRALGWVWGKRGASDKIKGFDDDEPRRACSAQSPQGWTSWLWGGWRRQKALSSPMEEYWEAPERIQPLEIEDVYAGKQETAAEPGQVSRWWSKYLPTSYIAWPRSITARQSKPAGQNKWDDDVDGDFRTPPPSPTPPSTRLPSPFRLFMHSWEVEIIAEHYEICFNFLRHLFDLFVVGFLWTVSPPTKLVLEVLGVQGALRLWIHGMAMFLVSTVGMAGLLGLINEYLPQFALIYGIIQAAVISVSVRQSVIMDVDEEKDAVDEGEDTGMTEGLKLEEETCPSPKDKMKTS